MQVGIDADLLNATYSRLSGLLLAAEGPSVQELGRRLLREAAITTGAVEELYELQIGQTRSIAVGDDFAIESLASQGNDATNAFADQVEAYQFANTLGNSSEPITAHAIREIHAIACKRQDFFTAYSEDVRTGISRPHRVTLRKGEYKTNPNHVRRRDGSTLEYCPVVDTSSEMANLVKELQGQEFSRAHPIIQASYAHYGLVHIHPFSDGNGRVARALASVYLMNTYMAPLIVYPDRRMTYFQALEEARSGAVAGMVEYVYNRVLETLNRSIQEIDDITQPSLAEEVQQLQSAISSAGGISLEAASELAESLLQAFLAELAKATSYIDRESGGTIHISVAPNPYPASGSGYGTGFKPTYFASFTATLLRPAKLSASRSINVAIAEDLQSRFIFRVYTESGSGYGGSAENVVDFRYEDVNPTLSEAARPRIALAAQALARQVLRELNRDLVATLRQSGHAARS